jgi:hypothetical protein
MRWLVNKLIKWFGEDYWPLVFIYGGGFLMVVLLVVMTVIVDALR